MESAAWPDDVFTFALFSPDGRHVLTDGRQETSLHLWDADTGELVRAFDGYQMGISSAMFFPDGRRVVSSSHDKTCMTWDVATGRKLLTLSHPDEVWEATVSHDGRWILSGCRDGRACLWDAETGRLVRTLNSGPPAPQVDAVAFSPDDRWVAVGHYNGCLRLWSRETGELLKTMTSTSRNMYSAVFTPDGRRLLTGGKRAVEVWDVRTGEMVCRWDACKDPSDSLYGLVLSPDGTRLLTSWVGRHIQRLADRGSMTKRRGKECGCTVVSGFSVSRPYGASPNPVAAAARGGGTPARRRCHTGLGTHS